jgi:uroporphyrinogen-III synthase
MSTARRGIDALTFMSGSAARCFVERLAPLSDEVYDLPAFCIGSSTATVAREVGFRAIFTPPVDDFSAEGLVARLVEYFES